MYQTLYRKYRPKTIDDVVGQKIAVKIIKNSLKNNQINHAYLFSGPRGTGKTTMAKILAKSVNCTELHDGVSCEKCANCLSINNGETVDIIEIDAASNNGVDEIREIRNNVALSCSSLKYKIYIIDEVHMLTIGAFNALLKTLEEPPEHIIFILATTDVQKVPTTIISRCQCINFETISTNDIKKRLKYIAEQEKATIDEDVFDKLATISNGGLRDAIGNLEKLIVSSDDTITIEDFNSIFGFVDDIVLAKFFDFLLNGNCTELIKESNLLYDSGKNLVLFTNELIEYTRKKIQTYYTTNNGSCEYCELVFKLNDLCNALKNTDNIRAIFEAGMVNISNSFAKTQTSVRNEFQKNETESSSVFEEKQSSSVDQEETKKEAPLIEKETNVIVEPSIKENDKEESNKKIRTENNKIIMNNAFALANKNELITLKQDFKRLNDYLLDREIGSIACYLVDGNLRVCGDKNIIMSYEYESMVNRGLDMYKDLVLVLKKILNTNYNICILTDEKWDEEKKLYIENIKNKNQYVVQELKKEIEQTNDISVSDDINEASMLFGEDIVEVR